MRLNHAELELKDGSVKNEMSYIFAFYDEKVSQMIVDKYGIEPITALRRFLYSETYRMLVDVELEM